MKESIVRVGASGQTKKVGLGMLQSQSLTLRSLCSSSQCKWQEMKLQDVGLTSIEVKLTKVDLASRR